MTLPATTDPIPDDSDPDSVPAPDTTGLPEPEPTVPDPPDAAVGEDDPAVADRPPTTED